MWREAVDDTIHNAPDNHIPPSTPSSPSPDSMADSPQVGRVFQPPSKEDYSLFNDSQVQTKCFYLMKYKTIFNIFEARRLHELGE